jgi:hypothetical protein
MGKMFQVDDELASQIEALGAERHLSLEDAVDEVVRRGLARIRVVSLVVV